MSVGIVNQTVTATRAITTRRGAKVPRPRGKRGLPLTVLGIVFLAIMVFPVYWMVNTSFQATSGAATATWFPLAPTLAGYRAALEQQGQNFVSSMVISLGTVVLTLVVATPAAYGLARFRMRGTRVFLLVLLITQMIPAIVIANALYTLFNNVGLLNSYIGLILADSAVQVPFAILLMRAFMESIPPSLVEAALVDGASDFRAFVSIVVPISRNAIVTAALFTFLGAWGDFLIALTLTSTTAVRPITLGIYNYIGSNVTDWGPVMATSVLASLPAAVLLIFAQRYISAGALGGAVK
ncbi:ABC transporter permease [Curtobacterium sp. MMLR14_010]|jgi:multiple sugar transport system permease protein|uniref:carbohydrate ABC transporter permease n=1 Tax=Curtobacterium sp. MMLR14_010 TaxID=1898743 RepID=UPI0003924936|nr:carbohydrate ABC transporter permease [Curtobacterium sp. MMLR14_010]AGU11883.1 Binding-protein-dependent transport system inner membrane component [uncultured organism]OII36660.1 ABC transporter permease [Curtobacterium sp. MMLR14_010]